MYGLVVLVIYTIVMLAVTKLFSARTLTTETFHIADRKIGIFQGAMSIAATWIWAPALFTSAEKAYLNGWPGLFWLFAAFYSFRPENTQPNAAGNYLVGLYGAKIPVKGCTRHLPVGFSSFERAFNSCAAVGRRKNFSHNYRLAVLDFNACAGLNCFCLCAVFGH